MPFQITRGRLSGSSSSAITVPYTIEETDQAATPPLDAVDAVLAQATTDYGIKPSDWSFDELCEYAYEVQTVFNIAEVRAQAANPGGYTPAIKAERTFQLTPPPPQARLFALEQLQKSDPAIPDNLSLQPDSYDGRPQPVTVPWPSANDWVTARFPAGLLPSSFASAVIRCAYRLNSDTFFGYAPGTLMLVSANANKRIDSRLDDSELVVRLGFAAGFTRSVTHGSVSLTGVLPFSHVAYRSKTSQLTAAGGTFIVNEISALYELRVFEETAYADLALPSP